MQSCYQPPPSIYCRLFPVSVPYCIPLIPVEAICCKAFSTWKSKFTQLSSLSFSTGSQCSNIFSINIPYALCDSCINIWITAAINFPSWMIGVTDANKQSKEQHFLFFFRIKVFSYGISKLLILSLIPIIQIFKLFRNQSNPLHQKICHSEDIPDAFRKTN